MGRRGPKIKPPPDNWDGSLEEWHALSETLSPPDCNTTQFPFQHPRSATTRPRAERVSCLLSYSRSSPFQRSTERSRSSTRRQRAARVTSSIKLRPFYPIPFSHSQALRED